MGKFVDWEEMKSNSTVSEETLRNILKFAGLIYEVVIENLDRDEFGDLYNNQVINDITEDEWTGYYCSGNLYIFTRLEEDAFNIKMRWI